MSRHNAMFRASGAAMIVRAHLSTPLCLDFGDVRKPYFRIKIQTAEKERLRRRAERKQSTSKLREQSIRVLEIPRVKAFRKAAVGGTKDIERFGALVLIHPEPGQVGCRAKLK